MPRGASHASWHVTIVHVKSMSTADEYEDDEDEFEDDDGEEEDPHRFKVPQNELAEDGGTHTGKRVQIFWKSIEDPDWFDGVVLGVWVSNRDLLALLMQQLTVGYHAEIQTQPLHHQVRRRRR